MVKEAIKSMEDRMKKSLDVFRKDLAGIRAGRASSGLVERITVDCYGNSMPLNQVGTINIPEPRLIVIQPWDKSLLPAIEKAILKSDLGINPINDGSVIRLSVPQLTKERRQELVKIVRKKAEEERVAIRNIRRDTNDRIKTLEKNGDISEDESRRAVDEVQKATDKYIKEADMWLKNKEEEIMEV